MKKKLLVAAVAGALALPGIALAQSAVTITGNAKVGLENISIGSAAAGRANTSEMRMVDNSSRIIFGVSEDLGGGLSAIAQYDMRANLNSGALSASGNDWVGFKSTSWGSVTFGRRDLHYYHLDDTFPGGASALEAWSVSLLGYAGGGGSAIAYTTRTPNTIEYASPKWGMFEFGLAWSAQNQNDLGAAGATNRKGDAWNFAPQLRGSNWDVGYSYWNAKFDTGAGNDQRSDRLFGSYRFPQGFRVALAWDRSRLNNPATGAKVSERRAWSLPLSYTTGPHTIQYTYSHAGTDDVIANASARMDSLAYQYALSKRTQVGVTYSRINNDSGANYNFFTGTALGSADAAITAGEDPRILQFTVNHSF